MNDYLLALMIALSRAREDGFAGFAHALEAELRRELAAS